MSQPQKISDYAEFDPRRERRAPLPIINLPVLAVSEESDPTLEIRTLIEQLQHSARDARLQTRAVELEKDDLVHDLARAQEQIDKLRSNERELRSQFVEVTSLIRERDSAITDGERRASALAEALTKLEAAAAECADAKRERDQAQRQRDDTARRFESFSRASEDQARVIAEMQKQFLAIRQARDTAHAQILELTNRNARSEDEIAELLYQRDAAQKSAKQVQVEASNYRRQLDTVTIDRDVTAQQVEQLTGELDEQRAKFLDLAEQKSAVLQAGSEHAAALAEARAQVLSLTQERDAARNRAQEQARELEDLRQQFQKLRDEESQQSSEALTEAHEKLAAIEAQARESRHAARDLRQQVESLAEQLSAIQKSAGESSAEHAEARQMIDTLAAERDAAEAAHRAAADELESAARERDRARESELELESQLAVLRQQAAALESASAEAKSRREELRELASHFEKQRVETIELGAQLHAAQREIRELSASLAEARLQVKFATAAARAAKNGATKSDFAGMLNPGADAAAPRTAAPAAAEDRLTEKEAKGAIAAMRACFQSFAKTPDDLSLLNELHCHVHGFSERARATGCLAVHRLCASFSELTRGLYEIPEQLNPSTLRTVNQTIEFLAALMRDGNFELARDPAKALVYAVDDDPDNCEAIRMSLETAMIRTTCAQDSSVALTELAAGCYDLIFLDIALPGMDGFELCGHIRQLAIHASTPVVFLTGLATLENRTQSNLCGGSDFITKPFNLHELSVKTMTHILKAQLRME